MDGQSLKMQYQANEEEFFKTENGFYRLPRYSAGYGKDLKESIHF